MAGRELLQAVAAAWPAYRALKTVDSKSPLYRQVVQDIPAILRSWLPAEHREAFLVQGSTGAGNITSAPWIATFDPRVTRSATEGFYLVYLYAVNLQRLYLSIAFGTTQFRDLFPNVTERHHKLRSAANRLRSLVPLPDGVRADDIDLAAGPRDRMHIDYEVGSIFAIEYDLAALPDEAVLAADYQKIIALYDALTGHPLLPQPERLLEAEIVTPTTAQSPLISEFQPREPKRPTAGGATKAGMRLSKESKKVGDQGEKIVYVLEQQQCQLAGIDIERVVWHAERGETPGWDITACDANGKPVYIEVKASVGTKVSELILTANEWTAAQRHRDKYVIYLVTEVMSQQPKIERIRDPWGLVQARQLSQRVFSIALNLHPPSQSAGREA
jgi:hypothetical protein